MFSCVNLIKSELIMGKFIDLIGQRFGKLIVIQRMNNDKWGGTRWLCKCDCKNKKEIIVFGSNLRRQKTQSCGCLQKERTSAINRNNQYSLKHGYARESIGLQIYKIWASMKQRCINSNDRNYHNYGGRGIIVCERWLKFPNFLEDMGKNWKPGLMIERKNNDKEYSPGNCYWATRKQQNRNKRNNHLEIYKGETQCLAQWVEKIGINRNTLVSRLRLGWSIERALETPVKNTGRRKANE